MPTRSPVVRVQITTPAGRRTYELTHAKIRALRSVSDKGRVSDATPFATARALVAQRLLEVRGPEWFITPLGKQVCRVVVAKMNRESAATGS